MAVPIPRPGKIVCVGLNYRDHAAEQGAELPEAPLLFAKFTTALIGPGDAIVIPPIVTKCDYEAELGVVLGRTVRQVSKENAMQAVAGYVVANDVSARDLQFGDGQWTRGKSPDTFCAVGPRKDVPTDPRNARKSITCHLMRQLARLELEALRRVGDARTRIELRSDLGEKGAEGVARHDDEHVHGAFQRGGQILLDGQRLGKRRARQIPGVDAIAR